MFPNFITQAILVGELTSREAPIGTRAPAIGGGWWFKTQSGWKWNGPDGSGSTFPSPGGDWDGTLILPDENRFYREGAKVLE